MSNDRAEHHGTLEHFSREVVSDYMKCTKPEAFILRSVEHFLKHEVPKIFAQSTIEMTHPLPDSDAQIKHKVSLEDIHVDRTKIRNREGILLNDTVADCIYTNRTFCCDIKATIVLKSQFPTRTETHINKNVDIVQVPIPCGLFNGQMDDPEANHTCLACSFIVNGNPRIISTQTLLTTNTIYVFSGKNKTLQLECRSLRDSTPWSSTSTLKLKLKQQTKQIHVHVPFFSTSSKMIDMPLQHVCYFLGMMSIEQIEEKCKDSEVVSLFRANWSMVEYNVVIQLYADKLKKETETVKSIFLYQFAPHCERKQVQREHPNKIQFLFACLRRLLAVNNGKRSVDSRDHLKNKKVTLPGDIIASLFRQCYRSSLVDVKKKMNKFLLQTPLFSINNIVLETFQSKTFSSRLLSAFTSGNLSMFSTKRYFKSTDLFNEMSSIMQARQLSNNLHKESKSKQPRLLHTSAYGYICATSTVDGNQTGIQNGFTYACEVSEYVDVEEMFLLLNGFIQTFNETNQSDACNINVFINGIFLGNVSNARFVQFIRTQRRAGAIPASTSIHFDKSINEVLIRCDRGRFLKPVFIRSELPRVHQLLQNKLASDNLFQYLKRHGVIEYLDPFESCSDDVFVAANLQSLPAKKYYTHCHLHGTCILSSLTASLPFSDHNAAPRNTYWAACQAKSLLSMQKPFEPRHLSTTVTYSLAYSQRAVCRTFVEDLVSRDNVAGMHTPGVNCCVLVAGLGNNIEDCILAKKSSLERGLFNYIKKVPVEITVDLGGEVTVICNPSMHAVKNIKRADYSKIDASGLPKVGQTIQKGDIIVGCIERVLQEDTFSWKDISIVSSESGKVERILRKSTTEEETITVILSSMHSLIAGDKITSRHGQKGTIGMILQDIDMPFDPVTGISPDLVFNPCGFPSRMTVGQIFESNASKAALQAGKSLFDATPYIPDQFDRICQMLKDTGMHPSGRQIFVCGMTGQPIKSRLFTGVVHYGVLKHFSAQKIQARASRGRIDFLSKQPVGGKRNQGGQRFGEMERDSMLSHGSTCMLKSVLNKSSDGNTIFICRSCGTQLQDKFCSNCNSQNEVVECESTHTASVLFQYLKTLGINSKFTVQEK